MRKICFASEESDLFYTVYLAFITSKKAPDNMAELSTATGLLTKLKAISEEQANAPENSIARTLLADGGELYLEEVEYTYFTTSIYPPQSRWTHQGIETLGKIQSKFESAEKE
jgi:hypothetical protein